MQWLNDRKYHLLKEFRKASGISPQMLGKSSSVYKSSPTFECTVHPWGDVSLRLLGVSSFDRGLKVLTNPPMKWFKLVPRPDFMGEQVKEEYLPPVKQMRLIRK